MTNYSDAYRYVKGKHYLKYVSTADSQSDFEKRLDKVPQKIVDNWLMYGILANYKVYGRYEPDLTMKGQQVAKECLIGNKRFKV